MGGKVSPRVTYRGKFVSSSYKGRAIFISQRTVSREAWVFREPRKNFPGNTFTFFRVPDTLGAPSSVNAKEDTAPKVVVKKIEGKRETLERHVPQMLLRGEQIAIIVKIN